MRSLIEKCKSALRDSLPVRYQVPAKFIYNHFRGQLEPELDLLGLLIARNDFAIDIGGNRGAYTYRLWRLGARVAVFEPHPDCLRALNAWAAGKSGVEVFPIALSARAGKGTLNVPVDAAGVEHSAAASLYPRSGETREIEIDIRDLDSYGFECVSLVKVDVEGHESQVLDGAVGTVSQSQPAMLVEIEQRHADRPIDRMFAKICDLGYRGYFLKDSKILPLERFDPERHQRPECLGKPGAAYINNFVFLHQDRIARQEYGEFLALMPSPDEYSNCK